MVRLLKTIFEFQFKCFILTFSFISFSACQSIKPPHNKPEVLFICQFGTVKSSIAREIFNTKAKAARISTKSFSRGITPDPSHSSDNLRNNLKRDNIMVETQPLTKLSQADLDSAKIVVIFNTLPDNFKAVNARDWSDMPSANNEYDKSITFLNDKIDKLITEVSKN